jgi:predicted transcriptional regulator
MGEREYDIGAAELEVLKLLWDEGPASVRAVLNRLHEMDRKVAYTTVQTMLTRLEQKGFVRADKSDLAFVYTPLISREQISRSRLRKLLEQCYDGAAGPLILHLVRSEALQPEEIAELQKLIDRLDPNRKKRKP